MKGLKKKSKRVLAFALCLCMAMGVFPMGASAVGAEEVSVAFSTTAQGDYLVSKSGYAVVTDTTYTPAAGCKDIFSC